MKFPTSLPFLGWFALSQVVSGQSETEIERHRSLRDELARHDALYFREGEPEISDAAYDALKREHAALVARYPSLAAATSDRGPGDDRTGLFPTRRHLVPMVSLRKASTEAEVRVFTVGLREATGGEPPPCIVEPKYDGLALSLVYDGGRLVRAVTRGNGLEGDEVTANACGQAGVALALRGTPPTGRIELRAEVFATFAQFEQANRDRERRGEPPFAHPRAFAVGTLRRVPDVLPEGPTLSFVVHGWGAWEDEASAPASADDFAAKLQVWGLPVAVRLGIAHDDASLWTLLSDLESGRAQWPMPTDGVVIKVDAVALRNRLGDAAEGPRWALAFKYPPERVVTRVRAITWQVGRSGVITPVAELEPVRIGGVSIARATLHSPAHIARLGLCVGDEVEVERAGEVIPHILGVRTTLRPAGAEPATPPQACPSCATALLHEAGSGQVVCPRRTCPAQLVRRIEHYVSPAAVDIPGFGPVLLETLVARGGVESPADLYRLSADRLRDAGAGASAANLLAKVEASRGVELWRVIHGLGIPRVGATSSRAVARVVPNLATLLRRLEQADFGDLDGLAPAVRTALADFGRDEENRRWVRGLVEAGVGASTDDSSTPSPGLLRHEVVVFTGTLAGLSRTEAADLVIAAGGRVASSVSARTTLVVAGEGAGEKLVEARRRGLRIIGEAEFRALVRGVDRDTSPSSPIRSLRP